MQDLLIAGQRNAVLRAADVSPKTMALFLDVDGTLVDIAPAPGLVESPQGFGTLLQMLFVLFGGALAIITGRRIVDVDAILSPALLPAAGVHGSEFRFVDKGAVCPVATEIVSSVKDQLMQLAARMPGVLIEAKGTGIAVHYRRVPALQTQIEAAVREILCEHDEQLVLARGRMVLEVVISGTSKGTAMDRLLSLPPFRGRMPIMIGDDAGDIPAFASAWRHHGFALSVAGEHFSAETAMFSGPAAVREWLAEILESHR